MRTPRTSTAKAVIEPSRRELYGGLIVLAVLAGVAISRRAGPQQTLAGAVAPAPKAAATLPVTAARAAAADEDRPPPAEDETVRR